MKIGFTGTHYGMFSKQLETLRELLEYLKATELHYGDCVGADAQAWELARRLKIQTHQHPPTNNKARAYTQADVVYSCKPYLIRNHEIVDATEILIATPRHDYEELRSGTWATVRYARTKGREIVILYPTVTWEQLRKDCEL